MKRLIIAAMLAVASLSVYAGNAADEKQNATLKELIKNGNFDAARTMLKAQENIDAAEAGTNAVPAVPIESRIVQNAGEWAKLGTNLGQALVATAKEAGMAVAEFSKTPVGQTATAVIVYKVVGKDLVRTALALLLFGVGVFYMLPKLYVITAYRSVEYEIVPYFWGAFSIRKIKNADIVRGDDSLGAYFGVFLAFVATCLITWLMLPT
jgi:hypothetical protein